MTKDPSSHPELHVFLQRVVGLDTVDDESKIERRLYRKYPYPRLWDTDQSPPYSYWLVFLCVTICAIQDVESNIPRVYYMYANMASLNRWRQQRGFSTFILLFCVLCRLTSSRYLCLPPPRRRSRRHRPPHLRLPYRPIHLARHPTPKSPCTAISILSAPNWYGHEPSQQ